MSDAVMVKVKTERVIVSAQQRLVVEDRTVNIVNSAGSVAVVSAGPQGPPGATSIADDVLVSGEQPTPSLVWIVDHGRDMYPVPINFYSLDGEDEMEPAMITYINNNRVLATWLEPTAGTWVA